MKKRILLAAVILLSTAGFAQAQEELSGTFDVTYLSAYMWRGFDKYPGAHGEGAIQPSIDLDLYGTGFGLNVLWSRANTGSVNRGTSFENAEEIDLTLSYSSSCFEYETYATDYTVGWMYYNFPDQPRGGSSVDATSHWQEFFTSFSWPEICPEGIVPSYTIIRMWTSESSSFLSRGLSGQTGHIGGGFGGWFHILGLSYDLPVEDLIPDLPEQILHLSVAMVYNDGVMGADNDWSHAVLGVSTDFDLGNDVTLTPGLYHQNTFEQTVNPDEDITWVSLSVSCPF